MSNNQYSLANPKLLNEIESKKPYVDRFVRDCPDCFLDRRQQLQLDSIKHSIEIELAGELTSRGIKKERKRCMENLLRANGWGHANYQDQISESYIIEIGKRVEPNVNKWGYRESGVIITGSRAIPPGCEKIESEMNNFLFFLNCFDNPIDKAVYSHFHIARIHPFGDGNGRTARLVQNLYLNKNGFLPITIDMDDRKEYLGLVSNAVLAHNDTITRFRDDACSDYNKILRGIEKPSVTLKEISYYRDLGVRLISQNLSKSERDFYDFLVIKLRDLFVQEFNQQSNKRLNDCCRKEFRELTKEH
ncbi:MAG: Fic family protein [Candidatus Pacearchaeota archaeon]|jgi:Fic family protein